jgi:hypothetical protein
LGRTRPGMCINWLGALRLFNRSWVIDTSIIICHI